MMSWTLVLLWLVAGVSVGIFVNYLRKALPQEKSIWPMPATWSAYYPALITWWISRDKAIITKSAVVEFGLGSGFLVIAWLRPEIAMPGVVFLTILVAGSVIDLEHMIIPDQLTIGGTIVGLVACALFPTIHGFDGFGAANALRSVFAGFSGACIASGFLLWLALFLEFVLKKDAMGFGDVKLMGVIGVFVGWKGAIFALFGGSLLGCAWLIISVVAGKAGFRLPFAPKIESPEGEISEAKIGAHISFGPMLSAGAIWYLLSGHSWVNAFLARQ